MNNVRDYSSINTIKEFSINDIAPKYFDMEEISQLNVGLFGYVNEIMANSSEDIFNAVSTYSQEIFPHKSIIPENIYSYAAFYGIDNIFSRPAELNTTLVINEADILQYGLPSADKYTFVLDAAMSVEVEGVVFMPEYNIVINAKPTQDNIIFSAMYDISFSNTLSEIKNPYIKCRRIVFNNQKYLALTITLRQMVRNIIELPIITNDKINLPSLTFDFEGKICNFEVFYRENQNEKYIQLKKKLIGSSPTREQFCFYKIKSETEIEITFSPKESYFQPAFNSELKIITYTTKGTDGNFPYYNGTNISVIPSSEEYPYNNNLIMFALPQTDSMGGTSGSSLEELKDIVHEQRSTLSVYTTENDLQLYFNNLRHKYGTEILFIKKRDDIFERLFTSFILLKDVNNNFYNTNTTDIELCMSDFDTIYDQTDRYMLKPGRLFKYKEPIGYLTYITNGILSDKDILDRTEDFLYTNPFLIMVSGNVVGFYLNSINTRAILDYEYVNNDSITQFICNNIEITRNAALGDDSYVLTISVTPSSELIEDLVDASGNDLKRLVVKGVFNDMGVEVGMIDFTLRDFDLVTNVFTFTASVKTDDYITLNNKIRFSDILSITDGTVKDMLLPMFDSVLNIYTFYRYEENNIPHKFSNIKDILGHTMTNMYSTIDNKIDFVTPISLMRSTITYLPEENDDFKMNLSFIPLVDAKTINTRDVFYHFMETTFVHHKQLQIIMDKVLNNHGIDMKFYNTFGRSKNFTVGERDIILDRVNCGIYFKVFPNLNADNELEFSIRSFIKNYIEKINEKGANAIYISNLIQQLQNNFRDIKYLKFVKINEYPSAIQVIENKSADVNTLSRIDKQKYVPEYLTLRDKDIKIELIYD